MSDHTLDIKKFREMFPEFSDPSAYPDARIELCWDLAQVHVCSKDGPLFSGKELDLSLNLVTAHILFLMAPQTGSASGGSVSGGAGGIVTSATVDKVSVSMSPPPFSDSWDYWLSQTPYGLQFLALLSKASVGGFYFGGLPERLPIRKVGGIF